MTDVFSTIKGTKYLKDPVCVLLAATSMVDGDDVAPHLLDLHPDFAEGVNDIYDEELPVTDPDRLTQMAGQFCYLAFGKKRTPLSENEHYVRHILESGHGSVLEHSNFTVLFLGIDRATTHELVRHRAGCAYSQVSQRFVGPEMLRFVMPWEDRLTSELTGPFHEDIDHNRWQFARRIEQLKEVTPQREGEGNTDWRKRIQSSARSVLGNYVEAGIIFTGNARAWRHIFSMRGSKFADVRIRRPFVEAFKIIAPVAPALFQDFELTSMPDGTEGLTPKFPKV